MSAIKTHFKNHGIIHLLWIISILILIVAAFLVKLPNSNTLTSYISFAASIASLVLALVAIFYSIISNQSFNDSASILHSSADGIGKATRSFESSISDVLVKATSLLTAVERVPSSVQAMKEGIEERVAALSAINLPKPPSKSDEDEIDIDVPIINGVAVALYALFKSNTTGQHFTPDDFELNDSYLEGIMVGTASTLSLFAKDKVDISAVGSQFYAKWLGSDPKKFNKLDGDDGEFVNGKKILIDEFFHGKVRKNATEKTEED